MKSSDNKPDSKELLQASLVPGNRVDIVFSQDEFQENMDVRSSLMHEVTKNNILILAQTSPPALPKHVGQEMEVTFLVRVRKGLVRHFTRTGYRTKLLKIVPNYLVGQKREAVLAFAAPTEVREANLRMNYRITPPSGVKMHILPEGISGLVDQDLDEFASQAKEDLLQADFAADELFQTWMDRISQIVTKADSARQVTTAAVHDISFGGAKLAHTKDRTYPPKTKLNMTLVWGSHRLELKARVVRIGELEGVRSEVSRFTSVSFEGNDSDTRTRLNRLIGEMNRQQLAKLSGLD